MIIFQFFGLAFRFLRYIFEDSNQLFLENLFLELWKYNPYGNQNPNIILKTLMAVKRTSKTSIVLQELILRKYLSASQLSISRNTI